MSKTAPLNNTYLGINGNYFTGDKLPAPAPNNPKVPFDAGQMFLDFPTYDAPIDPNDVMLLENKFDVDYHNDVIARKYMEEVAKARTEQDQQQYNERQFEFNENEINNFVQVCPKEMLDKLDNPITLKGIKKVS